MQTPKSINWKQILYFCLLTFLFFQCKSKKTPPVIKPEVLISRGGPDLSATPESVVKDALPFTIEFVEQTFSGQSPLPAVQSYSHAITPTPLNPLADILIVGGRRQGLHTFLSTGDNFPVDSANNFMYVVNPASGTTFSFDVNQLDPSLAMPLQSSNQQSCFIRSTGMFYLAGGYGWNADKTDMLTYGTMIGFNLQNMVDAIKSGSSAETISGLMKISNDDRFAVTGGELSFMQGRFYLVFGQKFMGQYNAFGGGSNRFTQEYTNEVRMFTLNSNLEIISYGATNSSDPDAPFHRRDGNVIEDIDPVTGNERISAFGGVFPPGIIGAYTYPVYINGSTTPVLARNVEQKFSQYECPIISIYNNDNTNPATIYHTFFGGISHNFYWQTSEQKAAYDTVSVQGRNDGLPFVADVTTMLQTADGTYEQYIHTKPIPGYRLLGTSIPFIVNPTLISDGKAFDNGVIKLQNMTPGSTVTVGYIYGGIEAEEPLPLIPNNGTYASNTLFAVNVTFAPSDGIPASEATEAVKNIDLN